MLSVVVCTYNREKYIYNQLCSLAQNELSPQEYEFVVINNNSTDRTEEECCRFKRDFPEHTFRYFIETQQGLSYARNRGIKESRGDVLVYVDDDATVNKEYLSVYASFFKENADVMAAGGPVVPVYEVSPPRWNSHYVEELITGKFDCGNKTTVFKKGSSPRGGNAAYRKEVFEKVGLFNVELGRSGSSLLGSEEKDIFDKMNRLKMKMVYLPAAILYHIIPAQKLTKAYFNRLSYSIGVGERLRTLAISKPKYYRQLLFEFLKWGASFLLCLFFCVTFRPQKGFKLLVFRWNVSRGLLGF